jgi:hypothetical protein
VIVITLEEAGLQRNGTVHFRLAMLSHFVPAAGLTGHRGQVFRRFLPLGTAAFRPSLASIR